MALGYSMGKRQAGGGSNALGNVLLANLGLGIHVEVTSAHTTYLRTAAHHVHSWHP